MSNHKIFGLVVLCALLLCALLVCVFMLNSNTAESTVEATAVPIAATPPPAAPTPPSATSTPTPQPSTTLLSEEELIDAYYSLQPPFATKTDAAYAASLAFCLKDYRITSPFTALVDLDFDGEQEMVLTKDVGSSSAIIPLTVFTWDGAEFSEVELPPSVCYSKYTFCDTLECYRNRESGKEMYVAIGGEHHRYSETEEWVGFSTIDGRLRGVPLFAEEFFESDPYDKVIDETYYIANEVVSEKEYTAAKKKFLNEWEKTDYEYKPLNIDSMDMPWHQCIRDKWRPMLEEAYK